MAKMTKRTTEPEPKTDAFVGRELGVENRKQNEEMTDSLIEGQAVQYYACLLYTSGSGGLGSILSRMRDRSYVQIDGAAHNERCQENWSAVQIGLDTVPGICYI